MKIEIKQANEVKERPFPKLMISESNNNEIVLFCSLNEGIALKHRDGIHHYSHWNSSVFKDFDGSVVLSNE